MSLNAEIADEVLAACQSGADDAASALSRALDATITATPGDAATLADVQWAGSGLILVLKVAKEAAVVAIAESTGLLPAWYATPDATGTSKLATLAQELGMLLLPESCQPDDFAAIAVTDLPAALVRGGVVATATAIPLTLATATHSGAAWLIWPATRPAAIAEATAPADDAPVAAAAPVVTRRTVPVEVPGGDLDDVLTTMPSYTRSLLKIRVPIVVTLAKSHQPLSRIIELAPGSIIPFTKSCDDTLTLEVNNREVAVGEAVKVGDKFGLRITSMTMPPERFVPLQSRRS